MDAFSLDKKYIAGTYARFPVNIKSGKGSLIYDADGKEYIDMGAGIATNIFGIADEDWVSAVTAQLGRIQHASNLYYTDPCARLAKLLCEKTGMKKVFFSNSGAEANECAIKTARKWAAENKGEKYNTIITLKNSFHGRTLATLAATGQDVFHKDFLPITPGFEYAEAGDADSVEELLKKDNCAAIMFEVVQGEGGVNALDADFIASLGGLAEKYEALLVVDEVQTGNGRCGELYAYMNFGISPDIVTTAKGLGGGLPIGATMFSEKTADVLTAGTHGSTFGGNPVCCAGAASVIERIDEALLESVREKSAYIKKRLEGARGVKSVSGMGLMLGIEVERDSSEFLSECMEKGLLVLKAKNKIRLTPALNIPMELLEKAMDIMVAVAEGETKPPAA